MDEARLLALGGIKTPGNGFIFKNNVRDLRQLTKSLQRAGFVCCLLLILIALVTWVLVFMVGALTMSLMFATIWILSSRANRLNSVWISSEGVAAEFTRSVSFHPWPWYSWIEWGGKLRGQIPHMVFSGGDTSVQYEISKEMAIALEAVRGQANKIAYQKKNPYSAKRESNMLMIVFLIIFAPLYIIPIFVLPLPIGGPILLTGAGAFAWAVVRYKPIDPYVSSALRVDMVPEGVAVHTAAETYTIEAKDVVVLIMPRKPDDHATLVTRKIPSPFVLTSEDAGRVRAHYSSLSEPIATF